MVQATLDFVREEVGAEGVARVLERLDGPGLEAVRASPPLDEVPLGQVFALWNAVDAELGPVDPEWMERAGAYSIESAGRQQYGGIVGKPSPLEFLTQRVSLFRLFYRSGRMEVVSHDTGSALLRLVDFGPSDPLFCRRQTGGLRRALVLARGGEPRVRHVRCVHEGDAFCEWALGWDG
ncbi:MAG: hypothetical protein EA350_09805 [Gemmatimonadales bacterium]|nr:MAG: hypothetical protein EA350_09805 [Gemmatimonadales bacterium]